MKTKTKMIKAKSCRPMELEFPSRWEAKEVLPRLTEKLKELHEGLVARVPVDPTDAEFPRWKTWIDQSLEKAAMIIAEENETDWNNEFFQEALKIEIKRREEVRRGIEALIREEEEKQKKWYLTNPWRPY
jgi:hypothetical protein